MRALMLLVGTNPLPNWVAWRYLHEQQPFDRVILVCSQGRGGTQGVAQRIAAAARLDCDRFDLPTPAFVHARVNDAYSLPDVERAVANGSTGVDELHLHFTGGTKAMSVAATRMTSRLEGEETRVVTSYLDPVQCCLHMGDGTRSEDLRTRIALGVSRLCELHGVDFVTTRESALLPQTARALLEAILNSGRIAAAVGWCSAFLDRGPIRKDLEWPEWAPKLADILATESGHPIQRPADINKLRPAEAADLKKFLNGTWLESIVMAALDEHSNAPHWMGFEGHRPGARKFEIDVVAMKGYQLIGVSCGRSTKNEELKRKCFEIAHRSAQLGGGESRAFLVTTLPTRGHAGAPSVSDLQLDVSSDLGGARAVTVLGIQDLRNPQDLVSRLLS